MKAILASVIVLTALAEPAAADMDRQCYTDCLDRGYSRGLCTKRCSFDSGFDDSDPLDNLDTRTDRQCLVDCIDRGYRRGLCESRCSYEQP